MRRRVRVLLVENDLRALPIADALRLAFEDAVITTLDPLDAASFSAADLVVVARNPWNEDDAELCRRLRNAGLGAPILAISGPSDAGQRAATLRAGADDFVAAPFALDELVARAAALVRRASSGSRHARAGAFAVDFVRRQIFVDQRPVTLTLREYDLLAKLIEHAGEVVSRRELARSASFAGSAPAAAAEGESNTVEVHVSRIREKLGLHASAVETVRGIGYRLRRS